MKEFFIVSNYRDGLFHLHNYDYGVDATGQNLAEAFSNLGEKIAERIQEMEEEESGW